MSSKATEQQPFTISLILSVRRMDPGTQYFLKVQLVWIGISLAISLALSVLLPFPLSLIAIIGVIIGLTYYQRRKMLRNGVYGSQMGFMGAQGSSAGVNFYCISCGMKHREASCPKCGSRMKRAGF